ncbi:MAG: maltooligosyltrehalose trehalohydrolase, partial [Pseudonocardiales bacterium]|nr:maltooligosyltrehalose trehalohydrolase [Pseudonocardiales bacterium]
MHTFTVWAPAASAVSLVLDGSSSEMQPGSGGWWELAVPSAGHGTSYAFSVDGSEPMPDPRSA